MDSRTPLEKLFFWDFKEEISLQHCCIRQISFWLPADVSDGLQTGCKMPKGGINSIVLVKYIEPEVRTSYEMLVESLFFLA